VLVLRNFGLIVGGETIEEAFWLARNVMTGIDKQVGALMWRCKICWLNIIFKR